MNYCIEEKSINRKFARDLKKGTYYKYKSSTNNSIWLKLENNGCLCLNRFLVFNCLEDLDEIIELKPIRIDDSIIIFNEV